jgi:hypothetical protein
MKCGRELNLYTNIQAFCCLVSIKLNLQIPIVHITSTTNLTLRIESFFVSSRARGVQCTKLVRVHVSAQKGY